VSQAVDRFELGGAGVGWRPIDHVARTNVGEPVFVLELKFERRRPRWMVSLVRRLDLIRRSFSKYCYGIEAQRTVAGQPPAVPERCDESPRGDPAVVAASDTSAPPSSSLLLACQAGP
jgi:hypothetical protein